MSYRTDDCVTMDVSTYNILKASEVKANLVIDELFRIAALNKGSLVWKNEQIDRVLELTYPKRYQNKILELSDTT